MLFGQVLGNDHGDGDQEVAGSFRRCHASPFDAHHFTVLGSFGKFHAHSGPIKGGDVHLGSQCGFCEGHRQCHAQVETVHGEHGVGFHCDGEDKVSWFPTVG